MNIIKHASVRSWELVSKVHINVSTNKFSRPSWTEIKFATRKCDRFNVYKAQYDHPDKELSSTINSYSYSYVCKQMSKTLKEA